MPKVTLFGAFQDMAGWREREVEASDLSGLIDRLEADTPELADHLRRTTTLVIVGQKSVPASERLARHLLDATASVAFGPPVSGG